jgi:hypothetical protein
MDAWLAVFQKHQPGITRGARWSHPGSAAALGALMLEVTDVAPLARDPWPTELAPYAHQFKGDMMKEPVLIRVAADPATPRLYLAVNRRPGAPLPQKTKEFLTFVLSREGQQVVAQHPRFFALSAADAAQERAKLAGYLAPVDPAIPAYRVTTRVSGPIANVGSDGMESLMEKWMRAFTQLQPNVHRGARWSHQGTLNGYQALLGRRDRPRPDGPGAVARRTGRLPTDPRPDRAARDPGGPRRVQHPAAHHGAGRLCPRQQSARRPHRGADRRDLRPGTPAGPAGGHHHVGPARPCR